MNRIVFLLPLVLILSWKCNNQLKPLASNGLEEFYNQSQAPFFHGVASGDPLSDAVIIWTRVTTAYEEVIPVQWEVSLTSDFTDILQSGIKTTDAYRDFTIKVDVQGLEPATNYFYRFIAQGIKSPTGRTQTFPDEDAEQMSLGIVSCSNYEFGYFNAYDALVDNDVNVVLHLGDYIYEYGPGEYGDTSFVRKHLPSKELITLDDYRTRYAQYRLDKSLQRVHQNIPFISVWDDHEIANNAFASGAQNHQISEGSYLNRKKVARQAYYEWQPIRDNKEKELYRKFNFGNLAEVFMLDERYTGRQAPTDDIEKAESARSMLGSKQLSWFKKGLSKSTALWKIVGNQVIFSPCDLSIVRPSNPINLDAWDGYASERDDIITFLNDQHIQNTIFVTGDTHASWAFEVPEDFGNYSKNQSSCAIEIATPSITSSNWNDSGNSDAEVKFAEQALLNSNPHLKYVNGRDHGVTILTVTRDKATAEWHFTEDIKTERSRINLGHKEEFEPGKLKFTRADEDLGIAIENITVIPMTGENDILKNQTVEIKDGLIEYIGNKKSSYSNKIDGSGKFLIPGLTEMHAHIPVAEEGDDELVKETLFLYLSQGVTTIRGMLGNPYHLELKNQVANGEILGPRIYSSSPSMNGNSVQSPNEAIQKVTQYKRDGYDFLKIHPGIKLHVWEALERTANEVGIDYAGHVPVDIGVRRALKSGYATIDHLDGYLEGLVPSALNANPNENGFFGYNFTELADISLIDDLADLTIENEVAIVTTQTLFTRWFSPESPNEMMTQDEMQYMSPETRFNWRQSKTRILNDPSYSEEQWIKFIAIRNKILQALRDKGAVFLLGSDAPQVMNVPGFSIHHEMKAMTDSGFSNYEILQSGTSSPAEFFKAKGKYGQILQGSAADLVILNQNPLDDISNSRSIHSVIVKGEYLSRSMIDQRLSEISLKNRGN